MPPKKKKKAAKAEPAKAKKKKKASSIELPEQWQWKDDDGKWNDFADEDAEMLETRWLDDDSASFATTDFSFNTDHSTVYKIDYTAMTQTNAETGVARAMRRGVSSGPSKKLKTTKMAWFWMDDEDEWQSFADKDAKMLESEYIARGPKAKFKTKDFSFNKGHGATYELDFSKMSQTNTESKNSRQMRRGEAAAVEASPVKGVKGAKKAKGKQKPVVWEWFEKEEMEWHEFDPKDAVTLEAAFASGTKIFVTKKLTWNEGYDTEYIFDFIVMAQINNESGTSRKMRRNGAEDGGGDEDGGFAKALDDAITGKKSGKGHGGAGFTMGDMEMEIPKATVAKQKKLGAQSLRGGQSKDYGPAVSKDKHGSKCFDEMLANEAEFAGEWVVFYHSYSVAALLYEVQAAVAAVLFRFKSEFASLPRLLWGPFEHIPTAKRMLEEFPKWPDRDHNKAFRGVGLCGVSSLLAPDSEAPPKSCFLAGYSVGPLTGLLEGLLKACGVSAAKVKELSKQIIKLAGQHGLDASAFGGAACKSGRQGHYLQIFVRRDLCDEYVYPSFPFGVPDKKRQKPLSKHLEGSHIMDGQIRITANPDVFLRATCARMFVFSADPLFHSKRQAFQKKLTAALAPLLGTAAERTKAARGIFGGTLPDWWSSEDQSDASKMSASRYGASVL